MRARDSRPNTWARGTRPCSHGITCKPSMRKVRSEKMNCRQYTFYQFYQSHHCMGGSCEAPSQATPL